MDRLEPYFLYGQRHAENAGNGASGIAGIEIVPNNITAGAGVLNMLPVTTPLSVGNGGDLDLGGGTQQVASISDVLGQSPGTIQNSGTSTLVLTISNSSGWTTFSGVIAGGAPWAASVS